MKGLIRPIQPTAIALALLVANALLAVATPGTKPQEVVRSSRTERAINEAGIGFAIATANYSPDTKLAVDHNCEGAFAYIPASAVQLENSATEPLNVYQRGDGCFEPLRHRQFRSENANRIEPANMVTVFVAENRIKLATSAWGKSHDHLTNCSAGAPVGRLSPKPNGKRSTRER